MITGTFVHANQKHPGYRKRLKFKANQKQQSKWLYVATRFDMKLRPRILFTTCIKILFKILVC